MKTMQLLICAGLLAAPLAAHALGIRLFDHDAYATARGEAFVATADNASALYYNPAGLTQLRGHNLRGSVYTVDAEAGYQQAGTGRRWETDNSFTPLPGLFYAWSPEDGKLPFAVGVAYYMPFGLSMEWPDNAPFRAVTTRGALECHTFSSAIAWRIMDGLSIAAGPAFHYAKADLSRGLVAVGDEFRFRGDGTDWGAAAGILWQPAAEHSFGFSYRSETKFTLSGRSRTQPALLPVQNASVDLRLPPVFVAGYSFRPTTNWNFEVDLDWTRWSDIKTPVLRQASGPIALPLEWDDSWAVEAGATRFLAHGLRVSAGYVYLENSAPTRTYSPLVPDQDLHVFSAGVGGGRGMISWDLTYQFTIGPGRDVRNSVNGPTVSGQYTFTAHAISLAVGLKF
jgi:long-chain fatty acid transport protein